MRKLLVFILVATNMAIVKAETTAGDIASLVDARLEVCRTLLADKNATSAIDQLEKIRYLIHTEYGVRSLSRFPYWI
jgi:hypothetical protein